MIHIVNHLKQNLKIITKIAILQLDQYTLRKIKKVFIDTVGDPNLSQIPYRTLLFSVIKSALTLRLVYFKNANRYRTNQFKKKSSAQTVPE